MGKARNVVFAVAIGTAMVASLGLAACGDGGATQSSGSVESASAAAQESSSETYNLTKAWVGMGDDNNMAYYYEGDAKDTGAFLVYYTADNAYQRWLGTMEAPADNRRVITDAESGETFAFTIESEDEDGTISIKADSGLAISMSPSAMDEIGGVLDEIGGYATKVEDAPAASSSAATTASLKDNPTEAEHQIQAAMQYLLEEAYGDKVDDARVYVEKVYTAAEEQADETLKSYNLGPDEVAFQVRYELHPADGADPNQFTAGTGEYDEDSGWIVEKYNVGILRPSGQDDPAYTITDFGTGF